MHHLATGRLASGRTGFGWDESGAVGVQQVDSWGGRKWPLPSPIFVLQATENSGFCAGLSAGGFRLGSPGKRPATIGLARSAPEYGSGWEGPMSGARVPTLSARCLGPVILGAALKQFTLLELVWQSARVSFPASDRRHRIA